MDGTTNALRLAPELSLGDAMQAAEDAAPASMLKLHDRATGRRVPGAILEAAVKWSDRYLLFLTDDVPQEEFLTLELLDAGFQPLDRATLGRMYTTGSFEALRLLPPDRVAFHFIGERDWIVTLLHQPQLRLPLLGDPPGVSRPVALKRHFMIEAQPR